MSIVNKLLNSFKHFPERIAISEAGKSITYKLLFEQSLNIASYLSVKNIRNSCIAVEVDDTTDHVIAIVGIIMSGNYYVSVTAENKSFFTEENILPFKLHICSNDINVSHPFVLISDILKQSYSDKLVTSLPVIDPMDKLCAFFTSGSTGSSKIVVHNHNSIFTKLRQEIEENEITHIDKLDFVFSLSFSASLSCIFPALLTGAEVCIFNLKEKGLHQLPQFWEKDAITFTTLSVTAFQGVCKLTSTLRHLTSLRFISISAEPVKDTTLDFFRNKFSSSAVLQIAYATTETRTISDLKIFNNGKKHPYPQSIGKPVGDKRVYIMGENGEIQDTGVIGEIVVESKFIADAYLGRPEESALSFTSKNDSIQYRTGDLGYLNVEGYLFYCGRKKNEIKINGIKINFTNIEEEIERIEGILQAVAVVNKAKIEHPKLVCFYQSSNAGLSGKAIKSAITAKLPSTHLPLFYIRTDDFPYTHSGKIDRKLLEQIDVAELTAEGLSSSSSQPKNTCEQIIIDIFKKVLETDKVNADSDFFDLGGDSFSCLLCIAEIEMQLGVTINSFMLIANPTPQKINLLINKKQNPELISVIEVNGYSSDKKNIFILNSRNPHLLQGPLSEKFNIICLHYDINNCFETSDYVQTILKSLVKIVSHRNDVVVLGYSFNGYIAHRLAAMTPQITYCVLIDTLNYIEFESYKGRDKITIAFKNIIRNIFSTNDYALPLLLMQRGMSKLFNFRKTFNRKEQSGNYEAYVKAIYYFLENLSYKKTINHCIYFNASRSFVFNSKHGDWQPHVGGDYYNQNILADHMQIMEKKHVLTITNYINKIIT